MTTEITVEKLGEIAKAAGDTILSFYGDEAIAIKSNQTPLTQADLAAHALICEALKTLTPDIPILSEESDDIAYDERKTWERYWLIDPLDGTREFINQNGEFTVNMALIVEHEPVVGVVYAPVRKELYCAVKGRGATMTDAEGRVESLTVRKCPGMPTVMTSRSHQSKQLQEYLNHMSGGRREPMGSSLKFCILAKGEADCYPRFAPTSEWDVAAGHCILREAGGEVLTREGALRYNTKESLVNPAFVAVGDTKTAWPSLNLIQEELKDVV